MGDTFENGAIDTPQPTGSVFSYPKSRISLLDHFIDEPRPLRVAVIGGGLSGVLAGILLPAKIPGVQLTIFEKNKDFVSIFLLDTERGSNVAIGRNMV